MGLFEKIFGKYIAQAVYGKQYQLLSGYDNTFAPYDGRQWENDLVRKAVHAFAKNAAKVTPKHVRHGAGTIETMDSGISRLLALQPNPHMTAYAFYYKIAACYKLTNNAFIYPAWEGNQLKALYPILAQYITLLERDGELYCEMAFASGRRYIAPYSDLIHIRSHFYDHDIFGSDNRALDATLSTATAFNQSMGKLAKMVAVIRGILKVPTATKAEDIKARRDEFVRDNLMQNENGGGIIAVDGKWDFIIANDKQQPIPAAQLAFVKDGIYSYFGVSDAIVENTYSETEWNAFYESELEPLFIQLGQGMTAGMFTERERGFGNEIVAEANRLQFASISSKIAAATLLADRGAIATDQMLEIFNLAPIGGEEGARRTQTLNAANTKIVDQYQTGQTPKEEEPDASETTD